MDRRTYLGTVGAMGLGPAIAGCLGDDDADDGPDDEDDGPATDPGDGADDGPGDDTSNGETGQATFEFVSISPEAGSVEQGKTLVVTATVANTGEVEGDGEVDIVVGGQPDHSLPVSLEPGEQTTVEQTLETDDLAIQEHELAFELPDDSISTTVVVEHPVTFTFVALSHDGELVGRDETVDLEAVVENDGERQGTGTITVTIDGEAVAESEVSIAGGDSTTVTETIDASEFEGGALSYSFELETDTITGTVIIQPEQFGDMLSIGGIDELQELPFDENVVAEFSGTGDTVTDTFTLESGMVLFAYEYAGELFFSADLEETDDESVDFAIGMRLDEGEAGTPPISGASIESAEGGTYQVDVTEHQDEHWEIWVLQPRAPAEEVRTPPVSVDGEHDAVVGPVELQDGAYVSVAHHNPDYSDSLTVRSYKETATDFGGIDTTVTTEDPGFEDTVFVDLDGTVWFDVSVRGDWTLEVF